MNGLLNHKGVSYCVLEVIANNAVEFEGSKNEEKGGWNLRVTWVNLQGDITEKTYWGSTITLSMTKAAFYIILREQDEED